MVSVETKLFVSHSDIIAAFIIMAINTRLEFLALFTNNVYQLPIIITYTDSKGFAVNPSTKYRHDN